MIGALSVASFIISCWYCICLRVCVPYSIGIMAMAIGKIFLLTLCNDLHVNEDFMYQYM